MINVENIVNHLNDCLLASRQENEWVFVRKDIANDAFELLKQKVLTVSQIYRDGFGNKISHCPICNARIQFDANHHYCGFCGQVVKWND